MKHNDDLFEQVLTKEQNDHLYKRAFNAEKNTKSVRVEVDALRNLLIEHGRALNKLNRSDIDPEKCWGL